MPTSRTNTNNLRESGPAWRFVVLSARGDGEVFYVGDDEVEARRVALARDGGADASVALQRRDRSIEGGWRTEDRWSGDDWPSSEVEDVECGRCPACVGDPSDGSGAWWSCRPTRRPEDDDPEG